MSIQDPATPPVPDIEDNPVVRADDVLDLTRALVAVTSVSGAEGPLTDLVEWRLRTRAPALEVTRIGNNVVARTERNLPRRVVLAGHLDTVPHSSAADRPEPGPDTVAGLGAVDMKGGLAVMLLLAEAAATGAHDCTLVFYDKEEIGSRRSGANTLFAEHRSLVTGDVAIVLEPTNGVLEAGCQGNLVVELEYLGSRAHTARPWRGRNAIHRAAETLQRLASYVPPPVELDGLVYRQALSVVGITGGVQGNVVPDRCVIRVNYRHAPPLDSDAAREVVLGLAPDADSATVLLASPAAHPALSHPMLALLRAVEPLPVRPKLGWTDVGRFAAHGIAAVNLGPGDSELAHTPYEVVDRADLAACHSTLLRYLRTPLPDPERRDAPNLAANR